MSEVSVGISIGGDCCVVAVHNSAAMGRFDVAANDGGDRTTPACVAYVNGETLIGSSAKAVKVRQPLQTVTNVVQLLVPSLIQDGKLRVSCETDVAEVDGEPVVVLPSADPDGQRDAADVFRCLLQGVKATVIDGAVAGVSPKAVVLAVPRYVSHGIVERCAEAVGLGSNRLRVIGADVASWIALRHKAAAVGSFPLSSLPSPTNAPLTTVVVDWGGTSCAVSVLEVRGGCVRVAGYDVDFTLGGAQLDKEIVKMAAQTFQKKTRMDPTDNGRAMRKLLAVAEQTKHALTAATTANIEIEAFCEGVDLRDQISRMKFELAVRDVGVMNRVLALVSKVTREAFSSGTAGHELPRIGEIALCGGVCRIPLVATTLKASIIGQLPAEAVIDGGAAFLADVAGDEAAAIGACIEATILTTAATDALEEGDATGADSIPTLAQSVAIVTNASATSSSTFEATSVTIVAHRGTPLPVKIPLQIPAFTTAATALQLAVATNHDEKSFAPIGEAMKIEAEHAGSHVVLSLKPTQHQGLELRLLKGTVVTEGLGKGGVSATTPIDGTQRTIDLK